MSDTGEHVASKFRGEFPFPLFLYAVLFFFSGLLNTFQMMRIFYEGWIQVPYTLLGLINLYILQFAAGWVGVLLSISGILNVSSAVLVFIRKKYSRLVALANLVFGVIVGVLGFFSRDVYQYPIMSEGYLSLVVFLGVNAAWFYYFKKNNSLP
jgi:heme/copper-type cytochrome/quinol oxidase subunit 3